MAAKTFWITEHWLRKHSGNGVAGWTPSQLRVLGVTWPPARGWMRRINGSGIEEAQRAAFELIGAQHRADKDARRKARAYQERMDLNG